MSFYLDTNILVALLTPEPLSDRVDDFIRDHPRSLIVSDFAAAEFASAIARRVRTREIALAEAHGDLIDFDLWITRFATRIDLSSADVAAATTYLRRLDLALVTPDALHIALARRAEATLVTFDRGMAAAARAVGMAVVTP